MVNSDLTWLDATSEVTPHQSVTWAATMPLSLGLLLRWLVYENAPLGPTVVVTPYRELTLPRKVTTRPAGYSSTTLPENVQRLPAPPEARKVVMTGATLLTVTRATL